MPNAEWLVQIHLSASLENGSQTWPRETIGEASTHMTLIVGITLFTIKLMKTFVANFFSFQHFQSIQNGIRSNSSGSFDGWVRNFSPTWVLLCNSELFSTFRTPIGVFSIKSKVFTENFIRKRSIKNSSVVKSLFDYKKSIWGIFNKASIAATLSVSTKADFGGKLSEWKVFCPTFIDKYFIWMLTAKIFGGWARVLIKKHNCSIFNAVRAWKS